MYELIKIEQAGDWQAYHRIRREELFYARGRTKYNENHPDEYLPNHHPLLLKFDGQPIGTTRLDDKKDGTVVIRLVAIANEQQGQGHGRTLAEKTYNYAAQLGATQLYVNAAPEALGYYQKLGWEEYIWDQEELFGIAEDCIQMRKILTPEQPGAITTPYTFKLGEPS